MLSYFQQGVASSVFRISIKYLLSYPNAKPANVEDTFYWARVKFGLKPTLRVVQLSDDAGTRQIQCCSMLSPKSNFIRAITSRPHWTSPSVSAAAMTWKQPGFYLINISGKCVPSLGKGLTGVKGSIVRKAAVGRSVSNLKDALTSIKDTLEANP